MIVGMCLGIGALLVMCFGFAIHGDQPDDDHQM
jgi:hypothetical protein